MKIQEIAAYLRSDPDSRSDKSSDLAINTAAETEIQQALDNLSSEGSLAEFIQSAEAIMPTADALNSQTVDSQTVDSRMIAELQSAIAAQPVPTAVLYPIILEDRLETLFISPDGTIQHFQTPISKPELSATVSDLQTALKAVAERNIFHLATHAQFVVGQPEDSFILFGSGQTVNLAELRQWNLPGVELVVLSACQTAASAEGEGKEILGLGYQIQQTGASATLASLWSVDDTSTAALMNQFYIAIAASQSKAQALRTAQQKLIDSDNFSDPHEWAAFVLIGNGL